VTGISSEKYVCLTTFTKDGRRKKTPVWIADLDGGAVGFTAGADTWKVKRICTTPAVELAPSDGRGRVKDGVPTITGTARVVTGAEADYARIESALIAKYGFQFRLFRVAAKIRKRLGQSEDLCGIVITLD
jgi:PPOX class probable F420-dependent enzyme